MEDKLRSFTLSSFLNQIASCDNSKEHLMCGSLFELPIYYVIANLTDVDIMYTENDTIALQYAEEDFENFPGQRLLTDSSNTPPGFSRLRYFPYQKPEIFYQRDRTNLQGPAKRTKKFSRFDLSMRFPEAFKLDSKLNDFTHMTEDGVFAVRCPFWPAESKDWITRDSVSGWPSQDLKSEIVRGGCHVVSKPHHSNPNDETVWRFSFSQAEIVLINTWNDVQKYVYHILRVIKRRVAEKCKLENEISFSNYIFKTLMLWACEQKPQSFWNKECVETSVHELICETISLLIERKCDHYFISNLNILENLQNFDFNDILQQLITYDFHDIKELMIYYPMCPRSLNLSLSAIGEMALDHLLLSIIKGSVIDPMCHGNRQYLRTPLTNSEWFRPQLEPLFSGVKAHLSLVLDSNSSETEIRCKIERAEGLFRLGIEENTIRNKSRLACLGAHESFYEFVRRFLENKIVRRMGRLDWAEFGYSRFRQAGETNVEVWAPEQIVNYSVLNTPTHFSSDPFANLLLSLIFDQKCHFKTRHVCYDGNSATSAKLLSDQQEYEFRMILGDCLHSKFQTILKRPSYLINCAFRANFYFTYLKNYNMALKVCAEGLQYIKDFLNCLGAASTFQTDLDQSYSMVCNVNLVPIFDDNIQTVFGFVILFYAVAGESKTIAHSKLKLFSKNAASDSTSVAGLSSSLLLQSRSVLPRIVVEFSSIQFLKYIGNQSLQKLNIKGDRTSDLMKDYYNPWPYKLLRNSILLRASASISISDLKSVNAWYLA